MPEDDRFTEPERSVVAVVVELAPVADTGDTAAEFVRDHVMSATRHWYETGTPGWSIPARIVGVHHRLDLDSLALLPPRRADLVEQYGEPDDIANEPSCPSNTDRAGWALDALVTFADRCHMTLPAPGEPWAETDGPAALGDLICDLLHLATLVGLDAEQIANAGRSHFECEVGIGYGGET